MKDIACVISNNNIISFDETIKALKETKFKKVFIQWYDDERFNPNQEEQLKKIKENGFEIIFAHLGYQNINDIWLDIPNGDMLVKRYKKNIRECHKNGINTVVMHLTSRLDAEKYNELGLKRIKEICRYAAKLKVRVAFENTKIKGYLEYILKNINSKYVGVCVDFGHLHAHFKGDYPWKLVKGKVFAVHIHDNHGEKDEHLLPYDGTCNYKSIIEKLKEANYDEPITMEIAYSKDYQDMDPVNFYKKGYEIATKIKKMF